jgi:hypothetical protein
MIDPLLVTQENSPRVSGIVGRRRGHTSPEVMIDCVSQGRVTGANASPIRQLIFGKTSVPNSLMTNPACNNRGPNAPCCSRNTTLLLHFGAGKQRISRMMTFPAWGLEVCAGFFRFLRDPGRPTRFRGGGKPTYLLSGLLRFRPLQPASMPTTGPIHPWEGQSRSPSALILVGSDLLT